MECGYNFIHRGLYLLIDLIAFISFMYYFILYFTNIVFQIIFAYGCKCLILKALSGRRKRIIVKIPTFCDIFIATIFKIKCFVKTLPNLAIF